MLYSYFGVLYMCCCRCRCSTVRVLLADWLTQLECGQLEGSLYLLLHLSLVLVRCSSFSSLIFYLWWFTNPTRIYWCKVVWAAAAADVKDGLTGIVDNKFQGLPHHCTAARQKERQ